MSFDLRIIYLIVFFGVVPSPPYPPNSGRLVIFQTIFLSLWGFYRPGSSSSSDPAATLKELSATRAASRDERRRTFGATLDAIKTSRTPQLY